MVYKTTNLSKSTRKALMTWFLIWFLNVGKIYYLGVNSQQMSTASADSAEFQYVRKHLIYTKMNT